jgi:hypothetical protein
VIDQVRVVGEAADSMGDDEGVGDLALPGGERGLEHGCTMDVSVGAGGGSVRVGCECENGVSFTHDSAVLVEPTVPRKLILA